MASLINCQTGDGDRAQPSSSSSSSSSQQRLQPCPGENSARGPVGKAPSSDGMEDIRRCGYLRKQKHGHKRFFVLRAASHLSPSRLEYFDSEKKFRNSLRSLASGAPSAGASPPKRIIYLHQCLTVNKRADSKNKHLIALYTKDEYFAMVAESEQEQEEWYQALGELMSQGRGAQPDADEMEDVCGADSPGTVFKEVWQVNVKPKGLGQTKNLTGVYRLCLSARSLHLVKLNSETPCVSLQLLNIRRCGHSESFFFIEVGRSSSTGPGELWMQVDDSVVAQNMHETILETMKALKAFSEFRPRSKSQSSSSNPVAFVTTRRHLGNLPPSQTGLQRRSRTESTAGTPPGCKASAATAAAFRFRTSSEGESTMNRPCRSATGSLVHLGTGRASVGRPDGGSRYARALPTAAYHARSASLPVSHLSSATSPVSVSSSSGHGSASDTLTRPSSSSLCGSPSDGGFNSSDEYGSSPGDLRYFRVRSSTPDSLGNTPPIREEYCLSEYMAMGRHRDESVEEEKGFRKRTHSSSRHTGGAGGISMCQKMTQTTSSLDESFGGTSPFRNNGNSAASTTATPSSSLMSNQSSQPAKPPSLCSDQQRPPSMDEGYMAMLPAVLPPREADYMPMQPGSRLSATQQADSQGYMAMLPGGGSEYMDMSPTSGTSPGLWPCHSQNLHDIPKPCSPYFSLPRSYKAPVRESRERDEYVPMSSPSKLNHHAAECPLRDLVSASPCELDERVVRPSRLPLGRHQPSSPGEYDFDSTTPHGTHESSSPNSGRRSPLQSDYLSVGPDNRALKGPSPRPSLVAPWNPPSYIRPLAAGRGRHMDDYAEMSLGLRDARSPTGVLRHLCAMEQCCPSVAPLALRPEPGTLLGEPQGRRRHSSETFSASPPVASPYQLDADMWRGSAPFDGAWMQMEGVVTPGNAVLSANAAAMRVCRNAPAAHRGHLNYMALNLRDEPWISCNTPSPAPATPAATLPDNEAYDDIDFARPDRRTSQD